MNVNECSFCRKVWNSDNLISVEFNDIKILLCPECKEKFDSSFVPVPKKPTNGDIIKDTFPNAKISINKGLGENGMVFVEQDDNILLFHLDWWNALYKGDKDADKKI